FHRLLCSREPAATCIAKLGKCVQKTFSIFIPPQIARTSPSEASSPSTAPPPWSSLTIKSPNATLLAFAYSLREIRLSPQTTLSLFVLLGIVSLRLLILFGDIPAMVWGKNPLSRRFGSSPDR